MFVPARVVASETSVPFTDPPAGTSWTFSTSPHFRVLGLQPEDSIGNALRLPSAIAAYPRTAARTTSFRAFVTYSGTNSLVGIDPTRPVAGSSGLFE
jgi:hypothetical protein